jgi:hypothetical protein
VGNAYLVCVVATAATPLKGESAEVNCCHREPVYLKPFEVGEDAAVEEGEGGGEDGVRMAAPIKKVEWEGGE